MCTKAEVLEAQASALSEEAESHWYVHDCSTAAAGQLLVVRGRLTVEAEMIVNKMKQFSRDFDFEMHRADSARRAAVKAEKKAKRLLKKAARERKRCG